MSIILKHLVILLVATALCAAARAVARQPDLGVILNEDGDLVLMNADADPAVVASNIDKALDTLKGGPIKTLAYQIGCGSDVLHYPTQVASQWGWRTTDAEKKAPWNNYMPKMRAATAAGLDSVGVAAKWAKANGLYFMPSYRLNDAHYCSDPQNSPLTGEFWVKHHEHMELKQSPVAEVPTYQHLLDFTKPEVRAYRMAVINEAIERYQADMQGFQLDFMRNPVLFPNGTAEKNADLITQMLAQVRSTLDALGKKNKTSYVLAVRVPPTLEHCRKTGLDVGRWLKEGLVDVVTPSPAMTLSYDMPVNEFVALAKPRGAKVYPAILDRTQFAWPFTFEPAASSYAGSVTVDPSAAMLRGAMNNYRAMDAAGVEIYNFNVPLSPTLADAFSAADPDSLRIYSITPHYWIDATNAFEPVKQIPVTLAPSKPATLTLWVGEALSSQAVQAALRLGFAVRSKASADDLQKLTIRANGTIVFAGDPAADSTAVTGKLGAKGWRNHPPPVNRYVQVVLPHPDVLKEGRNAITVEFQCKSGKPIILSEVQLGVRGQSPTH